MKPVQVCMFQVAGMVSSAPAGVDDRDILRGFRPARCNTQVQAGCQVARYHKSRSLEGFGLGPPNTAF